MATAKSFSGKRHAHGCRRCRTRYEDACTTPGEDKICITCRGGRGWQMLIDSASPAECCRHLARLVTKDEKTQYRLAGAHMWFRCPTCARTHPFDPKPRPEER